MSILDSSELDELYYQIETLTKENRELRKELAEIEESRNELASLVGIRPD